MSLESDGQSSLSAMSFGKKNSSLYRFNWKINLIICKFLKTSHDFFMNISPHQRANDFTISSTGVPNLRLMLALASAAICLCQ